MQAVWRGGSDGYRNDGGHMGEVVYRSEATIERVKGPTRRVTLASEKDPVTMGVHGAIAEHYGRAPGTFEPHAATIDYVVAATAG